MGRLKRILIRREALEFMLGVSREVYPKEFSGLLRGTKELIVEVLIIPGTRAGDGFATIPLYMKPIDYSIIGSVHSHPGRDFRPSKADLRFFGKTGFVHLILKQPYSGIQDIAGYDAHGNRIELGVQG